MPGHRTIAAPVPCDEPEPDFAEWGKAGEYREKTFRIERIPAPPEAKRVETRELSGEAFIGYQIACACRHCGEDVDFVFGRQYSEHVMRELDELRREVKSLRDENKLTRAVAEIAIQARKEGKI